ncbi:MAG: hypothetical protein FWG89_07275 [Treponema sp.]|nr:hypothetical protein [Treponema sp.]
MKNMYRLTACTALFLLLAGCPTAFEDLESRMDMMGEIVAVMEAQEGFLSFLGQTDRVYRADEYPQIAFSSNASKGQFIKNIGLDQGYLEVVVPLGVTPGHYAVWLRYSGSATGVVTVAINPDPGKEEWIGRFSYPAEKRFDPDTPLVDDWVMKFPKLLETFTFSYMEPNDVIRIRNLSGSIHIDSVIIAMPKFSTIHVEAETFTPVPGPSSAATQAQIRNFIDNPPTNVNSYNRWPIGIRHASQGKWVDYGQMTFTVGTGFNNLTGNNNNQGWFEYVLPLNFPANLYNIQVRSAGQSNAARVAIAVKKSGEAEFGHPYACRSIVPNGYNPGNLIPTYENNFLQWGSNPWAFETVVHFSIMNDVIPVYSDADPPVLTNYTYPDDNVAARIPLSAGDTVKMFTIGARAILDYVHFIPVR